jgi:hypothetical protein
MPLAAPASALPRRAPTTNPSPLNSRSGLKSRPLSRRLLNLLTALSLLLCATFVVLWVRSYGGSSVLRLAGYELLAFHGGVYVWSGERSLILRLHFMPLLLMSLAVPALRFASVVDGYVSRRRGKERNRNWRTFSKETSQL